MRTPLSFLRACSYASSGTSLGERLAEKIANEGNITTLIDCLCSSTGPAIISPDTSRPPLLHHLLRDFVSEFSIPTSKPLGPNDRVMLVLPTGPENALALLSLASYHTCAPVNANCTASELKDDARRLNAKAILTTGDAEKRLELRALCDELGCEIIYVEARTSGPTGLFDMTLLDGSEKTAARVPLHPPSKLHGLADKSLVLHTSGTSGKKKVVPYTLRSLIVGSWSVVHSWGLREADINMNMMPLFHVGGIVRNLLAPVLSGGSAIMCSGFDPISFWNLSKEFKATWYYAAPTIHHAILSSRPSNLDLSKDICIRMICNAAGGLLPSLAVELKETFKEAVILPSYGMTECMPIASPPTDYQLDRPGCSGLACGPSLSIRDPYDPERELPCGKTGAVSVRGLPTFEGYEVSPDINTPLDTSAFSSEGWFDSGDVGYLDADGYLYITGRSKEIINKGGEVISPFDIEEAIMTAAKDYVKTTLAFGIEHDVLQETIGVVIVPAPDMPRIGLSQLQDLLRNNLHPSKWPMAIVYMQDLPKNSAGKPLRIKLSTRLGIGMLTDATPALHRHFEAEVPHPLAPLTEPISCSRVPVHFHDIESALNDLPEVVDFALRLQQDGSPEVFVSVSPASRLSSREFQRDISRVLHGYSIPDPFHVFSQPLARTSEGSIDFDGLEKKAVCNISSLMSQNELLVRDIIADLLLIEPANINRDSDFFLLGGNSLLLGKLSHHIRRQSGTSVEIASLFSDSTIHGIAMAIKDFDTPKSPSRMASTTGRYKGSAASSETALESNLDLGFERNTTFSRGQTHPLNLLVQAIPAFLFYPLKATLTWSLLLFVLANLARYIGNDYWERMFALLIAIFVARLGSRIVCPLAAIVFKWVVIGKYCRGTHRMWSTYYLRWWIVNQSLRSAGKGVFSLHPSLEILYYRMLGARIGKGVLIDQNVVLSEHDLLTFEDGCRIDASVIRGFCVEREGYFRLDNIIISRRAVINSYTVISPGAVIKEDKVYGPHSSSHDPPSPSSFAAYNRTLIPSPHWCLQVFIAWPIILMVYFLSLLPWFASIWMMIDQVFLFKDGLNAVEAAIYWFSTPDRIFFHALSRVARAVLTPLTQLVLGIIVKRSMGLNTESSTTRNGEWVHLRRYVNSILLSQQALKQAFLILGSHYEVVSIVFRAMGAKVGRRVYWPGSSFYCLDPELLEIGDDVVFGSRSSLFTTDCIGTAKITIGNGAMIADRVVLLPGTNIGRRAIMGSGALSKRNTTYNAGSVWIGCKKGEAVCLNQGSKEPVSQDSTVTPFGRAYHERKASYFVFPYPLLLAINITVAAASATYWSISPVVAAQLLRHLHIHLHRLDLFRPRWYRFGLLFGLNASFFVVTLTLQAVISLLWVIIAKWAVIGRRHTGKYDWDQSSYCQRWQIHLALSRFIYKGYGNGGVLAPLTGSAYIVWYLRALGAKIGRNCSIYAGGRTGLMTEPDLVELGDNVNLDDCSVVAHINSRGNFSLNSLKISSGSAMRTGSRLLSGASMEDNSILYEHTLLTSGEVAEAGVAYAGWPARQIEEVVEKHDKQIHAPASASLICPVCRKFPKISTAAECGHVFCDPCINKTAEKMGGCPVCAETVSVQGLRQIYLSFAV